MYAWICSLMSVCEILCLQETDTTTGVWDDFKGWCWRRKYVLWGTPTLESNDGLVILIHAGSEGNWKCAIHDPDVTMSLTSVLEEDFVSIVINNRFSPRVMSLRFRKIRALSEIISQAQKDQIFRLQQLFPKVFVKRS